MSVSLALIEQLREFETALLTEAMAAMGVPHAEPLHTASDIRRLTSPAEPMVGVALTLEVDTSTPGRAADASGIWESYAWIQQSAVPVVVVMKCTGAEQTRECVAGDGMAKIFKAYGACGIVTDGGVRDLERIDRAGLAVFGSGVTPDHATLVYRVTQQPVVISGVTFATGDLVHGDGDGVIVVPENSHAGIVEACTLARDFETRAHLVFRRTDLALEEKRKWVADLYGAHQERCRALLGE
ncbi:MAG: RraA family protein [Armatimonadota bacterium]